MTVSERVDVKVIEMLPNGPVVKDPKVPGQGQTWRVPVVYVLENGERVETSLGVYYKAGDAKAEQASLPKVPRHETKAMFRDGCFVGTQVSFHIGRAS